MRLLLDWLPFIVGAVIILILLIGLRREATADQAYTQGLEEGREDVVGRLERTLRQSRRVDMEVWRRVMKVLDDLQAKVASIKSTEESAVALIVGLRQQLAALVVQNDGLVPAAKVQELIASLDASTRGLAAAVADGGDPAPASTPAETTVTGGVGGAASMPDSANQQPSSANGVPIVEQEKVGTGQVSPSTEFSGTPEGAPTPEPGSEGTTTRTPDGGVAPVETDPKI